MTLFSTRLPRESVGSPTPEYDSMLRLWRRSRAIIGGELKAKEHDQFIDLMNYSNLLVPFSPKMSQAQYRWYVAEAELPGLVSQYARVLVGGLLRKPPVIKLPEGVPEGAEDWINNKFTEDNRSISAFLDSTIWEEFSTSSGVISVDFPMVRNYEALDKETRDKLKPFPILWKAEEVINRQTGKDPDTGLPLLTRVVFRYVSHNFDDNPYHPKLQLTVADHHLDEDGNYAVQYYKRDGEAIVDVFNGSITPAQEVSYTSADWKADGEPFYPKIRGKPLRRLPIFFANGESALEEPLLSPLIDREIALYNKVSRRNHLLYGASTYTPVIFSNMAPEDFERVVGGGLGSWILLGQEDKTEILATPTEALADMERAIESAVAEMSRMGIRMLAPEGSGDSGVALEIRNAPQTAQLGVLNVKLSHTFRDIINLMLEWRYSDTLKFDETEFTLSTDFDPSPLGVDWLKLVTEWYQARIIPRSTFIKIAKHHDILPTDYDDEEGIKEISEDVLTGASEKVTIDESDGL
jgi:hypothetical protein